MSEGVIPVSRQEVKPHQMVYADPATGAALKLARSVARTSSTVLLTGESGVGKEVFARAIHQASPRKDKPFVAVNCAALPSTLLESELFGHEKGAFSGAVARHQGHFERAHGGTILLDEISEVSLETQAKLLRVLQERRMLRVGGRDEIKLDIRVIATTNRNLRARVDEGAFRLDLLFRLNVFPIKIPSLRERRLDIEPLVLFYLSTYADRFDAQISGITVNAMDRLRAYRFDGNVRELVNVVERAVILCADESVVTSQHIVLDTGHSLPDVTRQPNTFSRSEPSGRHLSAFSSRKITAPTQEELDASAEPEPAISFLPGSEPLTDVRQKIIIGTLERFDGNRTRTAEALGVSLRTIRNKLRDYRERGIDVPSPEDKS